MNAATLALCRAAQRLTARLEALSGRLDAGDETVWPAYAETAQALAAIAPALSNTGAMLTTRQLADVVGVAPKTLRRWAKDGEIGGPVRLGPKRGPAALRWRGTEVSRQASAPHRRSPIP